MMGIELGFNSICLRELAIGGLFHDIGKVKIDSKILNKDGKLSRDEMEVVKMHSYYSYDILIQNRMNNKIVQAALNHHEKWDGTGYPGKVKGESIPLYSRIISIADTYDAITNNRPYSIARTHEEAVFEIVSNANKQFDPNLIEIFISVIDKKKF